MARFSLNEGTSGGKRKKSSSEEEEEKKSSSEEEEELKRKCGRSERETSELEEEEEEEEIIYDVGEEEEITYDLEDDEEMEQTCEDRDGEFKFRIDSDVLDCSICFEPLRPPVFQCRNGHIACSDCCPKLLNKCHVCHQPIGRRRCIALEKVIESIMIPCHNANYGCKDIISFANKASHEETCDYTALFCPVSNCTFSGSKSLLCAHALRKHCDISKSFSYDQAFMVTLEKDQPLMLLLGNDDNFFLLHNSQETFPGNVLSVICIGSNNPKPQISYELSVNFLGNSLELTTSMEKMKKWNGVHPCKAFLVVPDGFTYELSILVSIYYKPSAFRMI